MKDDAQKALEELEEQLLSDDVLDDSRLLESIINEVRAEESIDKGFDQEYESPLEEDPRESNSREDRIQTILMFVGSGLSLGISGLLIFWLVNYL